MKCNNIVHSVRNKIGSQIETDRKPALAIGKITISAVRVPAIISAMLSFHKSGNILHYSFFVIRIKPTYRFIAIKP